ncbi:MAG: hypothetical protein Fur0046_30260 [Cyanobacteria bacterium J069]
MALVLMLALSPIAPMTQSPFLLFFGAVVISAWWGGLRAGLATSVLAALISSFFFIEPRYTFPLSLGEIIRTAVFLAEGGLISVLCGSLRTTNRRLDASLKQIRESEQALQTAHQHVTEILDSVTDGFYTLDLDWQFTYVNRQAAQGLRRSREALLGRSIWEIFPEARGGVFEVNCLRAIAEHRPLVFETADILDADLWFEIHINPLHDGLAVYVQEVTARKQAAQALSQSEARFRRIFECNMVAMGVWSHSGNISQANGSLLALVGYTQEDLDAGELDWQALTPREWWALDERAVTEIATQGVSKPYEKEFIHRQGHRVPVLIGGAGFADGSGEGVFFAIDLSQQKRAEMIRQRLAQEQECLLRELAAERAQFEAVLRQMPEGVMIADAASGSLILANEQSNRILRHTYTLNLALEAYASRVPFQAFHASGRLYAPEEYPLVRSLRQGEIIRNEVMQICYEDGDCIFIETSSSPVLNHQGEIVSAVVVLQDITQRKQTEAALRESEERLQVALKNAPIAVFSQDQALRYTWIKNPNLDYGAEDVLGKQDRDLVNAEAASFLTQIKQQVLDTGSGTREEVKITQAEQDYYYDLTVEPLKDATGQVMGITCAAIDISHLKRTELALRQSEERFRLIAERVQIIPWESHLLTDRFTYIGPQAVEILGYPLEDWHIEDFWVNHIYGPDRDWVPQFHQDAAAAQDNYDLEYRMLAADGRVVWIYDVVNVVRDATGPHLLRGIMIDITRRKREEQAQQYLVEISKVLSSSLDYQTTLNQLAQHLVPHLADWCTVHVMDAEGSIQAVATVHVDPQKVQWADAIRQQYPLDPDAPYGTPRVLRTGESEFYPQIPDDLLVRSAQDPEHLRLLREVGFSSAIIVPLQAHGKTLGALTLVAAESGRIYDQDDLLLAEDLARHAALAVDNAQLYQKAQQEQAKAEAANRIKDEFLAVLSHELRTPLNPILGWSNLLRSGRLDATKTAYALETIERNAKLQTQLIEDLLDVSRILQGKLTLNMAPVNLMATVEAAMETVKLAAEAKAIALQRVFSGDPGAPTALCPPLMVLGDAARLQQVIWNLLTNAVKFTPAAGQVVVTLAQIGSQAQIQVRDTGKGISAHFLPHVFDYFRQADSATTRKFGGLGLGLAIVRHLVELHGGTIAVESEGEGQGATFTAQFPLLRSAEQPSPEQNGGEAAEGLAARRLSRVRVLLVDDDTDTRNLIAYTLEQAGAQVVTAMSAMQAMQALEQSAFDVLVSDIGMPEMDGYRLIRQIRARPADQGGNLPAIALTAYAGEMNQQQAIAAGFQRHVSKPVDPADFVAIVAELSGQEVKRHD